MFEAGESEAHIDITINDDFSRESSESFVVALSDPNNIDNNVKEPDSIKVVIMDDDGKAPYFM